jgi:hypothetical protein
MGRGRGMKSMARSIAAALALLAGACAQPSVRAPQSEPPVVAPPAPQGPPASAPAPSSASPPAVNLSGFPPEYKRGYGEGCAVARAGGPSATKGSGQYAVGWSDGYRYCARVRP